MKNRLLFFCLIMCTTHVSGMKRTHGGEIARPYKKSRTPFPLTFLPTEMQHIIFEFMTVKNCASKQKDATQRIRALSHVNTFYNLKINTLSFSDELIEVLSRKYLCAHETIARSLATRAAFHRLHIQRPLKQLCSSTEKITPQTFSEVIDAKKINLEFTYTHKSEQKTALMISIDYSNNMYNRLLENGAKINGCNSQNWSALSLAAKSSYTYNPNRRDHFYKLIQQPEVNLNHQNNTGKSPLYILLFYIKKCRYYVSGNDIAMARALLQAGADPELPDRKNITPLDLANGINYQPIIELLENAIANRHAM